MYTEEVLEKISQLSEKYNGQKQVIAASMKLSLREFNEELEENKELNLAYEKGIAKATAGVIEKMKELANGDSGSVSLTAQRELIKISSDSNNSNKNTNKKTNIDLSVLNHYSTNPFSIISDAEEFDDSKRESPVELIREIEKDDLLDTDKKSVDT